MAISTWKFQFYRPIHELHANVLHDHTQRQSYMNFQLHRPIDELHANVLHDHTLAAIFNIRNSTTAQFTKFIPGIIFQCTARFTSQISNATAFGCAESQTFYMAMPQRQSIRNSNCRPIDELSANIQHDHRGGGKHYMIFNRNPNS